MFLTKSRLEGNNRTIDRYASKVYNTEYDEYGEAVRTRRRTRRAGIKEGRTAVPERERKDSPNRCSGRGNSNDTWASVLCGRERLGKGRRAESWRHAETLRRMSVSIMLGVL